jgi:predicted ATPase
MRIGPILRAWNCSIGRWAGPRAFEPSWIGRPHVTAITVNRLATRDIGAMIDRVVGNKSLPANLRQDIIERTDGIPLFVEEMTKAVLEATSEGEARRTAAAIPSSAVPASLQASLMARLDRLGPAKEVAQIAAAIGREFSHPLLAAVVRKPDVELAAALDRLISAGLLFRLGVPPHATYLFKHALVQDAAYSTLLRDQRRALHARIVESIENQFAAVAENQPELLARHCTEAGLIEKAMALWGKAGQRSLASSALVEAIEQLTRALAQIAALPATPVLRREEIKLQVALISPLIHVKGFAAPETKAAEERARLLIEQAEALGEPPEDPLLLFSVLHGLWAANLLTFDGDACRDTAAQILALAERQKTAFPLLIADRAMGVSLLLTGEITEGRAHLDRGVARYDPAQHHLLVTRLGQDLGATILCYRSWALWLLGYPDAALADAERALAAAREFGHAATLMVVLSLTPITFMNCGNYEAANGVANELIALADEKSSLFWKANGMRLQGGILALYGKPVDIVQMLPSRIDTWQSTCGTYGLPLWLSYLASAYAALSQFDNAWRCIAEARTVTETTKEAFFEAEVDRIAGEITLVSPGSDTAKAEAHFARALAVARKQRAKSLELRAAMSMARHLRNQGKRDAARDLLAPVYGWFTEGFDTLDLKDAKSLLDALASQAAE